MKTSYQENSLLAHDVNDPSLAPWYMFRNYQDQAGYQKIPEYLKPHADKFMADGFLVLENSISHDLCDSIINEFDDFTGRYSDYFDPHRDSFGRLHRIVNLHLVLPSLISLFSQASLNRSFQDAAFGAQSSIYTSLYFERGSAQDIHRDTPYFCTRPEFLYLGTWFALEDADLENGCLEVIRGGHLVPEFDREAFCKTLYGSPDNVPAVPMDLFDSYQETMRGTCLSRGLERESVAIKKGSVLIWHPQLPHGGGPILDPSRSRHSIVMHTTPVGVPVYQADAFFNPRRSLPEQANWEIGEYELSKYVVHENIDVMHVAPRRADTFE